MTLPPEPQLAEIPRTEGPESPVLTPERGTQRNRLLFVCSSLAIGRDGVGDYVRLLARQCRLLGFECAMLALHDGHILEVIETSDIDGLSVLRLPARMPWTERIARAKDFRAAVQADWMSLQFVPYGFHPKGIVWNLDHVLESVVGDVPLHVMFHELWIGSSRMASWKERLIGSLQRYSILRMLRALAPRIISTSNATYIKMLAMHGVKASRLTLFGNIPYASSATTWSEMLPIASAALQSHERAALWLAVFFGTLHPEWQEMPLFSIVRQAAAKAGRRVCFVAVGRLGAIGDKKWRAMAQNYGGEFDFVKLVEQLPERVSSLFQAADFGIAASPWQLIAKSGSAMAMIEHGLPVIANRDDWQARGIEPQEDPSHAWLHRCDENLEAKLIAGLERTPVRSGIADTARDLICELAAHEPANQRPR